MRRIRPLISDEGENLALAVAGDITYQNRSQDLLFAFRFLRDTMLLAKIPGRHMFVIPGEHDVHLKFVQATDDTFQFERPEEWNKVLQEERKGNTRRIAGRLSFYLEFIHRLGVEAGARIPSASTDFFWASLWEADGINAAVLGLNTVWSSCCRVEEDRGKLCLGWFQVEEAYQNARKMNHGREPDLVIALYHHPLTWLREDDREAVSRLGRYCHLALRAHLHSGEQFIEEGQRKVPVLSVSNFVKADPVPGFQITALDLEARRVHVWPYLWSLEKKQFLPPPELPEPFRGLSFHSYDLPG